MPIQFSIKQYASLKFTFSKPKNCHSNNSPTTIKTMNVLQTKLLARFGLFLALFGNISVVLCQKLGPLDVAHQSNQFGLDLFNRLSKANQSNLIFSPFSVALSMSMVYQGSEGNTARQLEKALGPEFLKSNLRQLLPHNSGDQSYQLDIANALLTSAMVRDPYKRLLSSRFNAELFNLTSPSSDMKLINDWCSNKTNGKIQKLLDEPPRPNTIVALLNAIYFRGKWDTEFDDDFMPTRKFYGINGIRQVPFMKKEARFNAVYLKEIQSLMVEFPYQNNEVSFLAFLPNAKTRYLLNSEIKLSAIYLKQMLKQMVRKDAAVVFPKFTLKSEFDLVPALQSLGITDLFNENAKLSKMSLKSPMIDQVKQVATIEVNEEGTEAAAATYVGMYKSASRPFRSYIFNRPFQFMIVHKQSGHILFVGRVNGF